MRACCCLATEVVEPYADHKDQVNGFPHSNCPRTCAGLCSDLARTVATHTQCHDQPRHCSGTGRRSPGSLAYRSVLFWIRRQAVLEQRFIALWTCGIPPNALPPNPSSEGSEEFLMDCPSGIDSPLLTSGPPFFAVASDSLFTFEPSADASKQPLPATDKVWLCCWASCTGRGTAG